MPVMGTVDTVGRTWSDNAAFPSNSIRTIERDPRYGTHVGWRMADSSPGSAARAWYNFVDLSGQYDTLGIEMGYTVPYSRWLCGIGTLPSGCAVGGTACSYPVECLPLEVCRDAAPGGGIFEVSQGPVGWWPVMAVTPNGWIHFVFWSYPPLDTTLYSRIETWPNWTNPVVIAPFRNQPLSPGLPRQNLVASGQSNRLALFWPVADTLAVRFSSDAGVNWGPVAGAVLPAFTPGSDTLAVLRSVSGIFDQRDSLHVVAAAVPYVRDTIRSGVAEVWHYTSGEWSRIRRADPESLAAPLWGEDIVTRPSVGRHADSLLVSVWQELTPSNREPLTDWLRSAIWLSYSTDTGRTWSEPGPLTDTTSAVANCLPAVAEVVDDRVWVCYIADSVAGHDSGPVTRNLVIVHSIPVSELAVAERPTSGRPRLAGATVARGSIWLPQTPDFRPRAWLLDPSGRMVTDLAPGENDVRHVSPGVYFVCSESSAGTRQPTVVTVRKVIIAR